MFKSAGRYHYVASETEITVSQLNLSEFSSDHNQNYPDGLPRSTLDIIISTGKVHTVYLLKTGSEKLKKLKLTVMSWSTFFLVSSSREAGLRREVATRRSLLLGFTSRNFSSQRFSNFGHRPSLPDLREFRQIFIEI